MFKTSYLLEIKNERKSLEKKTCLPDELLTMMMIEPILEKKKRDDLY